MAGCAAKSSYWKCGYRSRMWANDNVARVSAPAAVGTVAAGGGGGGGDDNAAGFGGGLGSGKPVMPTRGSW